jgi:autotransporter-associated beta strand protein
MTFSAGTNALLSGTGAQTLTKTGAGTLVLDGAGTTNGSGSYTGATTVNGGTLRISSTTANAGHLRNTAAFSVNNGSTLEFNGTNLLTAGHSTALADTRTITANTSTLRMTNLAELRIGNVVLNNGSTLTSNRTTTVDDNDVLLGDTSAGAATVSVTGTGASTMNGTGGLRLQGVQNFSVADTTGSSAVDLSVSMTLADPGTTGGTAGGINKTGAGTMQLSGAGSYTGPTTVNAGQLNLSSTSVSNITVKSGAAIGGTGTTTGSLTMESGSIFSVNGTNASAAVVASTVDVTGPVSIRFDAIPTFGAPQTVVYYNTALTSGSLANLSVGSGIRGTISENITAQSVEISLVSGTARTWNASASTAWDTTSSNWVEGDNKFALGDAVTFNDTDAVGTVVLNGTLGPESVVINNTTTNYSFSGTGKISGTTGLTKNGSGSAVILNSNDFTGSVAVNGGSLIVGNGTTGSISGTCPVSIATGATFEVFRGSTTVPNVFSGSGTLSFRSTGISGVGDFTGISSASTFTGGVVIDDSRLQITAANQLSTVSGVTVLNGGQLFLNTSGTDFATATYTYDRNVTITGNGWLEGGGPFGALRMRGVTVSGNVTLSGNSLVQIFGPSSTFVSTISGVISDGGSGYSLEVQASASDRVLSLTGTNTYSGPTTVTSGTLRVNGASLPNGGRLNLNGTAKVEITEPVDPVVEVVNTLFIAGIQQNAGTYGATGSGATNINDTRFAGAGVIQVTTGPVPDFAAWMAGYTFAPGADLSFAGDADSDGISNGIEQVFGTVPNAATTGLTQISATGTSVTYQHPLNPIIASDVTYSYQWSTDLAEWKSGGQTNTGGTTATITAGAPVSGQVTVTTAVTSGPSVKLFTRIVATKTP